MKRNSSQEILDSVRRIVRMLRVSSSASERRLGLSSAQLFVLQRLRDGRPVSLNELAARTLTHQSSVSVVVRKLVDQGLVEKRTAREDERRLEISITARGRTLLKRAPEAAQERLVEAIEGLPAVRKRALAEGLHALVSAADLGDGPAPLFFEEKTS
jgi:DNA-binding MarR family transcriptional regulator